MTLHEKHIELIERVNNSTTRDEHKLRESELRAWREGVEDAGRRLDYMAADWFYMDQGIEREMCCGVWFDWKPLDERAVDGPLWLCNSCGHEFAENDSVGVDISPECDERMIACPKCWANDLDVDGSLNPPNETNPAAGSK